MTGEPFPSAKAVKLEMERNANDVKNRYRQCSGKLPREGKPGALDESKIENLQIQNN